MRRPGCLTWQLLADPAAEHFKYESTVDVCNLITLEDVMEELDLGPNGCAVTVHCLCANQHTSPRGIIRALCDAGDCSTAWSTWSRTCTSGWEKSSRCVQHLLCSLCTRSKLASQRCQPTRLTCRALETTTTCSSTAQARSSSTPTSQCCARLWTT